MMVHYICKGCGLTEDVPVVNGIVEAPICPCCFTVAPGCKITIGVAKGPTEGPVHTITTGVQRGRAADAAKLKVVTPSDIKAHVLSFADALIADGAIDRHGNLTAKGLRDAGFVDECQVCSKCLAEPCECPS